MSVAMHKGAIEVLRQESDPEGLGQGRREHICAAREVAEVSISAELARQGEPLVPASAEVRQYAPRQEFVPVTVGVGESARQVQDRAAQEQHLADAKAAVNAVEFVPADVPMAETQAPAQAARPESTVPFDAMAAVNAYAKGSMN